MMINEMVQIHKGSTIDGILIQEEFITGTVVRVNKKSIRVHMTHITYVANGKVTREYSLNEEATFELWKTVETADKTVSIFKNGKYGIIKVVH